MSHHQLDARRLLCPMPVIKVQQKVKELVDGDILEVICTDPGVLHDIPAWCRVHGHMLMSSEREEKEIKLLLRVKK